MVETIARSTSPRSRSALTISSSRPGSLMSMSISTWSSGGARKASRASPRVSGVRRSASCQSCATTSSARCSSGKWESRSQSTSSSIVSTPAAAAAAKLSTVLPGAIRSAPLWPTSRRADAFAGLVICSAGSTADSAGDKQAEQTDNGIGEQCGAEQVEGQEQADLVEAYSRRPGDQERKKGQASQQQAGQRNELDPVPRCRSNSRKNQGNHRACADRQVSARAERICAAHVHQPPQRCPRGGKGCHRDEDDQQHFLFSAVGPGAAAVGGRHQ